MNQNYRVKWSLSLPLLVAAAAGLATTSMAQDHRVKITGSVSGFSDIKQDDVVDGALVVPTLRSAELLAFQVDQLLSPSEPMSAGPETVNVPGNIYFPAQREVYGFFPINLSKEQFSFWARPGVSDELVALRFAAPFTEAVDLARAHAPYTELVPLVSLKGFAYAADKDWSHESSIHLTVDRKLTKTASFNWTRAAVASNEFDVIAAFQKTPADRWMITDFAGKIPTQGGIATGAGMKPEMKILMARIYNDTNNKPTAVVGHFRTGGIQDRFSASGLPDRIQGAAIAGSKITWNPISGNGWIAVVRTVAPASNGRGGFEKASSLSPLSVLGDFGLSALHPAGPQLEQWVNPSSGSYDLKTSRLENEKISLLFIGTDRPVSAPNAADADPALFTYASQLSMIQLQ